MKQRTLAGLIAAPLVLVLFALAWFMPLPYVIYRPGPTLDVLGDRSDGSPIVEISGHKTYADDGELRMTTVTETQPEAKVDLLTLLGAWASDEDAVYPYDAVYEQGTTTQENQDESAAQMGSSQEVAAAVALQAAGYEVPEHLEVLAVTPGSPSEGVLETGDVITAIDGHPVESADDAVTRIQHTPEGQPVSVDIERGDTSRSVHIEPTVENGTKLIGVTLGLGYDLPIDVTINLGEDIGGPSAGLIFSMAIYDDLTPGSLTGGNIVAGTGTLDPDGAVGPIGGIQQKIAGASRDGAELFLVPADNCADAVGTPIDDIRLVRVETMKEATDAVEAWVKDPDATLPSCGGDS
ncbi:YlbL family protein [Nocardioides insulae]|uniref:YlbL family protein n=1 Tax=Nocardioides insulae TaxID=394734 RepID=UPI00041824C5|nr:PDZ domain-containing protein [Nocardioides insulae]